MFHTFMYTELIWVGINYLWWQYVHNCGKVGPNPPLYCTLSYIFSILYSFPPFYNAICSYFYHLLHTSIIFHHFYNLIVNSSTRIYIFSTEVSPPFYSFLFVKFALQFLSILLHFASHCFNFLHTFVVHLNKIGKRKL